MLSSAVETGGVVVTASRRLARHLRLEIAAQHVAAGKKAWYAAQILPWDAWLRGLWDQAAYLPEADGKSLPLLSPRQSSALWGRAVRQALGDADLLHPVSLVSQAAQSWQRASDWLVPLEAIATAARGADAKLLLRAARNFVTACEEGGWQDPARLASALVRRFREGLASAEGVVEFAGFDRITPAQAALISALAENGIECRFRHPAQRDARIGVRRLKDRDAEMLAAGAWARERLLANPDARVAIVVPGLGGNADRVRRLVAEGFSPGWQLDDRSRTGVNVSYGRALADYGLIDTALSILGLITDEPDFLALSRILRSPFLSRWQLGERARLEVALRELPDRRWTLGSLASALRISPADGLTAFLDSLVAIGAQRDAWRALELPSFWAERMDELLRGIGWAEDADRDSEGYQLLNAWRSMLNELSSLGRVMGEMSGHSAVKELNSMARETLFQPESPNESLQVMGMLEASGLGFDALWIPGMDTTTWPPAQRPDPLLPMALQREYGMPDATATDTLEYAQGVFSRLLASASEVVVSWPEQDGEAILAPSPLLAGLPGQRASAVTGYFAAGLVGSVACEPVTPDPAPAVAVDEEIPGGHGVLTAQRRQPFDAFAGYRLRALALETPVAGLSARDRGTIIHRALEGVYRSLPGPADSSHVDRLVEYSVSRALQAYRRGADARLSALIDLEAARSRSLVRRFLDVDLMRGDLSGILCEETRFVKAGPLTLKIRPDRIDPVAGGWLIIDYKTGISGTAIGTDPENPQQLQLVVYAMSQPGIVRGLALAVIHPHRIGYSGVRDATLDWPGTDLKPVEDWSSLLNSWKSQAHTLAEAVAAGDARINLSLSGTDQRTYAVLSRIAELIRDD